MKNVLQQLQGQVALLVAEGVPQVQVLEIVVAVLPVLVQVPALPQIKVNFWLKIQWAGR